MRAWQNDGREHERRPDERRFANGCVQPIAKARTQAGALSVRRRLSIIFQRPIRGSSPLTVGARPPVPAKPENRAAGVASPRAPIGDDAER